MAEVSHTIAIARPPAEVFARLLEVERLPEWQETALAVRREGDGPIGLGSGWVETRRFMGRDSDADVQVTELERDRLLTLAIKAGPIAIAVRHVLTATPEGTDLLVEVSGGEGVPRFMRGMAVKKVAKQAVEDFGTLKAQLEGTAGG